MPQPKYSEKLYAQAVEIADRLEEAAQDLDLDDAPALHLATGPIAEEIAAGATCCVDDQLGLAVMLAAELVLRAARV